MLQQFRQLGDVRRDAGLLAGERGRDGHGSPASTCHFAAEDRGTLSVSRAVLPERSLWDVWHLVATMGRSHLEGRMNFPRQPEIRIRSEGGKKAIFFARFAIALSSL